MLWYARAKVRSTKMKKATRLQKRKHPWSVMFIRYYQLFVFSSGVVVIIWSILIIELTLSFNSVQGVNVIGTTGQLIPFTIGAFVRPSFF